MAGKMRKKLHTRKGFTLAETLLAILILLLVSSIVAAGIPSARNAYEKVVLASNAEVLLSTTITSLRNELGASQDVHELELTPADAAEANTAVSFYHPVRGAPSRLFVSNADRSIMIQRYYSEDGMMKNSDPEQLISPETATGDLYVTYTKVECSHGIVTFSGLSVNRRSGSEGLAERETLSIRIISDVGED